MTISITRRCLRMLEKCKNMTQLKQAQAQAVTCGLGQNSFTLSRLLAFCADNTQINNSVHHAWTIFNHIHQPTICICNTMVKAFLLKDHYFRIFEVLSCSIFGKGIHPDAYTFPYLVRACIKLGSLCLGELVHGCCLKLGFGSNAVVGNSLISMYFGLCSFDAARFVFDEVLRPCVVSWTLMVSGFSKFGDVEKARLYFDSAPVKDRGLWGAIIAGYVQNSCFKECLCMFRLMQLNWVVPDEGIILSILTACAQLGALDTGIWINKFVERLGLSMSVRLNTGLINMYAKCGSLELAKRVFDNMIERDCAAWNAMIYAFALHGDGQSALKLLSEMEEAGTRPDDITFIAVLSGCCYSGLVNEGLSVLDKMFQVYDVEPKSEHYGCIVDLFSRAGLMEEAVEMLNGMPISSSSSEAAVAWRALLNALCNQGNPQLAEVAAERHLRLEHHSGVYTLLSNLYAASGKHNDAKRMRMMMTNRGVDKTPGCSSIKIEGVVHEFVATDKTHPCIKEVESILQKMRKHSDFSIETLIYF